ncbi:MAG: hypothetical protein A3J04_00275 [Candidatus Ryanbacteria bacterium RIFCSPLOWO2_02_FULL_47_14]|uniref:Ribosome-binding factor A n=1 Tax=Candidatus Ryanbacteria bacterium RIFCSPLOWO2_02_FULL_47_14 TaxID=1802129 RepID=A0A1G2H0Z1_9BACT|nr:MAG: hypothetical protein A3J04_00275 [Candidatus Ryanbacteria bacterium RIFCSPLOWO2_02_FULL_47_14]
MKERRRERLASFIREELPDFFKQEFDVLVNVLISILHIEITESGARTDVFVSVFPDDHKEQVAKALKMRENKAAHFLRSRLRSKYAPAVRFHVR